MSAIPSHEAIDNNLKGTVIIKGLTVHLKDENGDGLDLNDPENMSAAVEARERINLAGENGDKTIMRLKQTGKLAKETYRIIQTDIQHIVKALQRNEK